MRGVLYSVVGGYVTARLAPTNPMRHVQWLIGTAFVIGVASTFGGWAMFPHWYLIAIVVGSVLLRGWVANCSRARLSRKPYSCTRRDVRAPRNGRFRTPGSSCWKSK